MSKNLKIILSVLALVVVGGSLYLAALSVFKPDALRNVFNKSYSVVYLSTGEIYIGRLSTFPKLVLTDAYLLQIGSDQADPNKKTFQLAPLKDAVWSPDKIYLNDEQVVFTASIRADSEIAKTLKGK